MMGVDLAQEDFFFDDEIWPLDCVVERYQNGQLVLFFPRRNGSGAPGGNFIEGMFEFKRLLGLTRADRLHDTERNAWVLVARHGFTLEQVKEAFIDGFGNGMCVFAASVCARCTLTKSGQRAGSPSGQEADSRHT